MLEVEQRHATTNGRNMPQPVHQDRPPEGKSLPAEKLKVFIDLYNEALKEFKTDAEKTCEMIGVNGEHTNAPTAALVVVANAMMNLDEVVMKN